MSPFAATASLLVTKGLNITIGIGVILGVIVALRHRWFCRWICPAGLCMDGASALGRRLGFRPMRKGAYGQWIVLLTLGGALLGYPLLLWLDPLALFSGLLVPIQKSLTLTACFSVIFFIIFLVLNIVRPDTWCTRICPLGAFQDLLIWRPHSLRSLGFPKTEKDKPLFTSSHIARRTFIGLLLGAMAARMIRLFYNTGLRLLRPPGAVNEDQFIGLCSRCGNCIRSCPANIIHRDSDRTNWAGFMTPVLRFENDYCRADCTLCTQACPTGALSRITIAQKPNIRIGKAHVDMNLCLLGEDQECSSCKRWCPYDAIRYVFSEEKYLLIPTIDPDKCNGCGACEAMCPTKPQKAIIVTAI
ncbi:MAG: 4Fe-4S dicluster domain-containing protein [Sedimentisphaerales bacterium]|nr:4Fe-4S dicluster domain-containing protein [Sedimentisphaerales bacterium]